MKNALAVVKNIDPNNMINDFSWSEDGFTLYVAGKNLVTLYFSEKELGLPISLDEKTMLLENRHGKTRKISVQALPETPYQLSLKKTQPIEMTKPFTPVLTSNGMKITKKRERIATITEKINKIKRTSSPIVEENENIKTGKLIEMSSPIYIDIRPPKNKRESILEECSNIKKLNPAETITKKVDAGEGKFGFLTSKYDNKLSQVNRYGDSEESIVWTRSIEGLVTSLCGNRYISAIGCYSGTIYIHDSIGCRIGMPIYVEGSVYHMECNIPSECQQPHQNKLIGITKEGVVFSYNLTKMEKIVAGRIEPLLRTVSPKFYQFCEDSDKNPLPRITDWGISKEGYPIVFMSLSNKLKLNRGTYMLHGG